MLALSLAACGGGGGEDMRPPTANPRGPETVVRASDGSAELAIPDGALPAGVTASQITVQAIAPGETGATIEGQPPALAYRLGPDGTQFSKPVALTLTGKDASAGNAIALLLSGADGAPQLVDTELVPGAPGTPPTLRFLLPHFSTFISSGDHIVHGTLDTSIPTTATVGRGFTGTGTITWTRNAFAV